METAYMSHHSYQSINGGKFVGTLGSSTSSDTPFTNRQSTNTPSTDAPSTNTRVNDTTFNDTASININETGHMSNGEHVIHLGTLLITDMTDKELVSGWEDGSIDCKEFENSSTAQRLEKAYTALNHGKRGPSWIIVKLVAEELSRSSRINPTPNISKWWRDFQEKWRLENELKSVGDGMYQL